MFRQQATKLTSPLSAMARGSFIRNCSSKKRPEPLCAHHKDLVPPFGEVCKLKSFELKSDCTTFHMTSCGYDPVPKPKGPCPDENPCSKTKKWWRHRQSPLSKTSSFTQNFELKLICRHKKKTSASVAFIFNFLIFSLRAFSLPNRKIN